MPSTTDVPPHQGDLADGGGPLRPALDRVALTGAVGAQGTFMFCGGMNPDSIVADLP